MSSSCLKCRKNTENINPNFSKTSNANKNDIIILCYMW